MAEKPYTYELVTPGSRPKRQEPGQLWRQYFVAVLANLSVVAAGYNMGWTSPVIQILRDKHQSPLPDSLTVDQESWVGSLWTVGAMCGPLLASFAASRLGRKWGLFLGCAPLLLGWILVLVANSVSYLYAGRVMWGIAAGLIFTLTPMYCAEISTDDARGALGSFMSTFIILGMAVVYSVGPFISYQWIGYVGISIMVLFLVTFVFMPESPYYYLTNGDRESAAKVLMFVRGRSREGVTEELNKMAADVDASLQKTASLMDVFRGTNFKAFYIAVALLFAQQFSGVTAVQFYMSNIFEAAGSTLDSSISTMIIGFVQLGSSLVTPFVVDRLGRRMLLMISTTGSAMALASLGFFFLLKRMESPLVEPLSFLPVASLVVFFISYCMGLGPLPWAILGELISIEVKTAAAPLATAICWTMCFLVTKYFGPIAEVLGMYVAFWIFGGCCMLSFVFVLLVLPETKGKSFQQIQDLLAGRSRNGV